MSYRKNL